MAFLAALQAIPESCPGGCGYAAPHARRGNMISHIQACHAAQLAETNNTYRDVIANLQEQLQSLDGWREALVAACEVIYEVSALIGDHEEYAPLQARFQHLRDSHAPVRVCIDEIDARRIARVQEMELMQARLAAMMAPSAHFGQLSIQMANDGHS